MVSRNFILRKLEGTVEIRSGRTASVMLGYHDIALFDRKRSRGIWDVSGKVVFEGNDRIGHGCKINVGTTGTLIFGEDVSISAETEICCQKAVSFGKHNVISWDCLVMDTDLHKIYDGDTGEILNPNGEIIFEDDVWMGCRCIVLKNAHINEDCVVAAGSIISRCETESSSIIGDKGRTLRHSIRWVD